MPVGLSELQGDMDDEIAQENGALSSFEYDLPLVGDSITELYTVDIFAGQFLS